MRALFGSCPRSVSYTHLDVYKRQAEGTGELRGRTSDMDGQLNDKIDELIDGFTGADYEICSFVSEKNTQVDAVQFVMTTPAIEEAEARRAPAQEAQTLSLWQRLLALFQCG